MHIYTLLSRPSRYFPFKWYTEQLNRQNSNKPNQNNNKKHGSSMGLFIPPFKRDKKCKSSRGLTSVLKTR